MEGATATGCLGLGRPHLDRPLTRSALGRRTRRDALADAIVRQDAVLGTGRLDPVMVICRTDAIGHRELAFYCVRIIARVHTSSFVRCIIYYMHSFYKRYFMF